MNRNKRLLKNLQTAVEKLRGLGKHHDVMSNYDSADGLAAFVDSQMTYLAKDEISEEALAELWRIFAPTSEWDDYIGDIDLGESIFQDLNRLKSNF